MYEQAQPFGAEVKVLCRWEMESYLADAAAHEQCRAELSRQPRRPALAIDQELLDHRHALIPHAAINAACHEIRVRGLPDGITDRLPTRAEVESLLANRIKEQNRVPDEIARFVEQVAGT